MISPNCSESDHHLHHHVHHTATAASQTGAHSGGAVSGRRIVNSTNVCGARCRPMLGYQPQLQHITDADVMIGNGCSEAGLSGGRYSPHPNEMFLHHHGKLSIQPITGYDDSTNCCLPPPSPAPNSDRYIMGVGSQQSAQLCGATSNINCLEMPITYANYDGSGCNGSGNGQSQHYQHQQQQQQNIHHTAQSLSSSASTSPLSVHGNCVTNMTQKYVSSMQQCSISANTRFRLSDRYREVPTPKSLVLNNPSSVGSQNAYASATGVATSQPSSAARYVSSAHFLTQNTPLVTSDTYTYLSSTVHTPVKRYVPTPPLPNELYTDISMQPPPTPTPQGLNKCAATSIGGKALTQHVNTLPYRFRMKCCTNEPTNPTMVQTTNTNTSQMTHNLEHRPLSVTDYYATSPRTRPTYGSHSGHNSNGCYSGINDNANVIGTAKCTAVTSKDSSIIILHDQQIQTTGHSTTVQGNTSCMSSLPIAGSLAGSTSGRSSAASPITVAGINTNGMYVVGGNRLNSASVARANNNNVITDYIQRTPSIEYINATAMPGCTTPVTQMEANSSSGANNSSMNPSGSSATTCLHCNTVRRTTGVHQTTQTTGPISPTSLQQVTDGGSNGVVGLSSCNGGFLQNVLDQTALTLTPSTSEAHISSLSPSVGGAQHSRIKFSQNMDEGSISSVDQLRQTPGDQICIAQKLQQQPKNVVTQGTITEHVGVVGSMGTIDGQQHQTMVRQLIQQQPIQLPPQSMHQAQQRSPIQQAPMQQMQRLSRKKRFSQYLRKEIARFFGVDACTETEELFLWQGRQRRLALRRFGALKSESELHAEMSNNNPGEVNNTVNCYGGANGTHQQYHQHQHHHSDRPDILPAHDTEDGGLTIEYSTRQRNFLYADFQIGDHVERKASVVTMIMSSLTFIVHTLNRRPPRNHRQWSRSFAPVHLSNANSIDNSGDLFEGLSTLQEDEVFFDSTGTDQGIASGSMSGNSTAVGALTQPIATVGIMKSGGSTMPVNNGVKIIEHHRQIYMGERVHGWRTSAAMSGRTLSTTNNELVTTSALQQKTASSSGGVGGQHHSNYCGIGGNLHQSKKPAITGQITASSLPNIRSTSTSRGNRISAQLLDGVLENSRRPVQRKVKLFSVDDLDDRADHRPFFTYWINTVQILVFLLSLICYGIGPIGIGVEQKTGQVLVTSLSLQTVQHTEQRNVWIGPRNNDLVHMGAKFATCMRSDLRIIDVLLKTRRQERETACCIRNDDSGCVQSSQADCSVRGLFPTKSISTWKKWSPAESGPGGRISGSVCGLDPKYCDAPASIAPYEWPDDITKWPICRKTNSFSQRFRYKDHTAEHMVCEVIGHPCCTGVYGECRITTREYCDFVNGYFHEEASLCSQISCLNNVCGMLPFFSVEVPDQFYRLFTSLCLHAGILHLAITIAFQHVFLADLERLIGPIRTAIVYIGSGLAGNLTSAVLVPYKPEVGPLASLSGVIASLVVLLILIHWKHLRKPHVALFKLICTAALLFGIGTLPWQLNFAGLLAGIFCGTFLTIALVPFVSITKYRRKAKINLIWSCVIFHLFIYSVLLIIFYIFPTELTSLNVGEVLGTTINSNSGSGSNVADSVSVGVGVGGIGLGSSHLVGGNEVPGSVSNERVRSASGDSRSNRYQSMQQQYYYHHRTSDIITSGTNTLKGPLQQQRDMGPAAAFYHYAYHMNRSNNPVSSRYKYNRNNNNNNSFTSYYYADKISYANCSMVQHSGIGGNKSFTDKMKIHCKDADQGGNQLEAIGAEAVLSNSSNNNHLKVSNGTKSKSTVNIKDTARHNDYSNNDNSSNSSNGLSSFKDQPQQKQKLHFSRKKLIGSGKNKEGGNSGVARSLRRTKLVDILDNPHDSGDLEDVGDIVEDDEVLYIVEADIEDEAFVEPQHIQATAAVLQANVAVNGIKSQLNNYSVSKSLPELKYNYVTSNFVAKSGNETNAKLNDSNSRTNSQTFTADSLSKRQMPKRPPYSSVQLPIMNLHKQFTIVTLASTMDAAPGGHKTYSESLISDADTIKANRRNNKTKTKLFSTVCASVAAPPQHQIATAAAAKHQ